MSFLPFPLEAKQKMMPKLKRSAKEKIRTNTFGITDAN